MFSGAVISLCVAALAAVVSYGDVPSVAAVTAAQHIYPIAVSLFVVTALMTIFDLELPHDLRAISARVDDDGAASPTAPNSRRTRLM